MGRLNNFITRFCEKSKIGFNIIAFFTGMASFFFGWAFRKPYLAATYEGKKLWGVHFKIMLITFEVLGYALSKFYGIKFIPEINLKYRGIWIITFCFFAEVFLIIFGLVPFPYNAFVMIFDGASLGQLWGLIFSFLEGRKTSELLAAGMAISVIISVGILKSVGQKLLTAGIDEFWVPAFAGAIFFFPQCLAVFILESLPDPSEEDIAARTQRVVMKAVDRWKFFVTFAPGIIINTLFYMLVTAYQNFRDYFSVELFETFGIKNNPSIFTISEIIVCVVVCIPIGLFMLIPLSIWSLLSYHICMIVAMITLIILTVLVHLKTISGVVFMVASGICIYLAYMPYNSIIWDVVIALFKYKANNGLMMYIIDSFGFLTSVALLYVKNFGTPSLSWESFYLNSSYVMGGVGILLCLLSMCYYRGKLINWNFEDLKDEPKQKNNDILRDELNLDIMSEQRTLIL